MTPHQESRCSPSPDATRNHNTDSHHSTGRCPIVKLDQGTQNLAMAIAVDDKIKTHTNHCRARRSHPCSRLGPRASPQLKVVARLPTSRTDFANDGTQSRFPRIVSNPIAAARSSTYVSMDDSMLLVRSGVATVGLKRTTREVGIWQNSSVPHVFLGPGRSRSLGPYTRPTATPQRCVPLSIRVPRRRTNPATARRSLRLKRRTSWTARTPTRTLGDHLSEAAPSAVRRVRTLTEAAAGIEPAWTALQAAT